MRSSLRVVSNESCVRRLPIRLEDCRRIVVLPHRGECKSRSILLVLVLVLLLLLLADAAAG